MSNITKRTLSLLVVIAMCLSFIVPSVKLPAAAETTVDYKYAGDYIYNWGNRGETATFLSPNAVSFYQSNGVSYDTLAQLAGSANIADVPSTPLFNELQDLMKENHDHTTDYDETKGLYQYTDCLNNAEDTTKISTFYTGKLVGPGWDSGKTWNREHTWPQSKGRNGADEDDIIMLRPADASTNSSRGNKAYGEGSSYYDPNSLGQNVRGDAARIVLYQYVRWGCTNTGSDYNPDNIFGAEGIIESKEILLNWMEEDPVDTWEMGRNDSVESITGTRNVFVDYPELAFILFGEEVPEDYTSPSNGTSVELELATAQFSENGNVVSVTSAYAGQKVTLPEHLGVVLPGYTFVGWVESTVDEATTRPTVYEAGSQYTLAADTTLYALYSFTTEGEGGSTGGSSVEKYVKVTSNPGDWTGDYLIVYETGKLAFDGSRTTLDASGNSVAVEISDGAIEATDAMKKVQFTIEGTSGNYTVKSASGYYIGQTSNANGLKSSKTTSYAHSITFKSADEIDMVSGSAYLRYNANSGSSNLRYRYYKSGTYTSQKAIQLYKLTEGQSGGPVTITNYTTTVAPCEHEHTENRAKVPAQCEIAGTEAGVFCLDCQTFLSGGAEIAALEHIWVAGEVTPPTATEQGYTTYTCQNNCGQTKQDDFQAALGVKYTVKFSVPTGVTPIADALVDGIEGTTLPVPSGTPGAGYQFVGWAEAAVETTTAMPTVLDAFYIPAGNITLYAVYTYTVGGSGRTEYTLVTSADELGLGHEIVIVGVDGTTNYAMSTTQNNNNRGRAEVTVNEDTVSWAENAGVQTIILEEGTIEGTYAMNVGTGYLFAAASSNNYLKTQGSVDANASWLITFEEGVPTVKAQGANTRNWLRHNTSNDIFSCYGSGQADVKLYSKGIPGTVYYSSLSCTHANATAIPEVEAECETNGYEEGVFCPDCQTYVSGGAVIPMLGHNMKPGEVTPPTATEQGYTVYNCANGCGKTEQRDYTDPTGEIFEVSFVVPTGVAAVAPMTINALTGDTLPTAGAMTGNYTYTFAGWAEAAITEDTTTVPVLYTGNYKPTADITLYAVYTYSVGGGGTAGESWKLVTNAANLTAGDQIAIVGFKGDAAMAMGTTQNNNNRASVSATVDTATQTLTMTSDIQVITVEEGADVENTIALNVGTGYLYAAGSDKNYLRTQTTNNANGCWSVEITADGIATLKAQGANTRNWMRFNSTNTPPIFACYGSGQNDIYLYEKVVNDGSTVYYTSVATGTTDPEQPPVTPDPDVPTVQYNTQLTRLPADGEYVVIVNSGFAMSKNASGAKLAAVTATVTDNVLAVTGDMAHLKVVVEGDKYIFMLGDKYLTSGATGNGLSYTDTLSDLGRWTMESDGNGAWYITNVAATYKDKLQGLEYYNGVFTTYGVNTTDAYKMQLFLVEAPEEGGDEPVVPPVEPEYPEADTTLTISEAIALGTPMTHNSYTPGKYYVTGVITEVYNTTYGNMYIKDENGNTLTIYGTYDATGEIGYSAMTTKPVAGDQITVYGIIGNYSGKAQMKNGWITAHTPGVEEPPAEPVAPEFPVSDKLVTKTADLLPGTYKLAGYVWKNSDGADISAAPFHLWNGTVNYGDLVTSSYAFADDTFTAAATDDAADVVLVGVPGKENTYYIMVGEQYLYSTESANRKLALGDEPVEWVATDNEKGGISLSSNGVFLGSANAKSKFLRSYTDETTPVFGVCFFKVNIPQPADPIALKSMNMQLGSSMSLNLNGLASVLNQYENVYVVFQPEGGEPVKVSKYFESTSSDGTLRYNFAYEGLTILDLNLTINYTIYGTFNGKEYSSQTKSISLLTYCRNSITRDTPNAAVPCANLLKYAIAAEAYMKTQMPELDESKFIINVLTEAEKAKLEQYAYADEQVNVSKTSVVQQGSQVQFRSQALDMVSRITMLYKMAIPSDVDKTKLTFKVEYNDMHGNPMCKSYTFEDLVYETQTGYYVLKFSEFNASQMRDGAKCIIYIDGVEHGSYTNSIENYCYTAINKAGESELVKNLAKRISLYGDACYEAYGDKTAN